MAWFRRKRDDDAVDDNAAVDEAAPSTVSPSGASDDVVRASRSQAGDWMAMPPMPVTVGPPPSTFRVQRVSEIMTTRRPMAFMGQLGHQVSSSAPSGHVDGLATTVAPPTAASHPIDLPLHGRTHHEDVADEAPGFPSRSQPPEPEMPAVQRSVRDLAPDEPVTAQTLGVARQALPTVQRELASSPAPSASAAPVRPALPEPSPSRVLREPTRPATPLEARVPSIPVVASETPMTLAAPAPRPQSETSASSTPWGDSVPDGDFVQPDQPVEFMVSSADPAPLAGDVPLQRRASDDISVNRTSEEDGAATSVDLPLASPAAPPAGDLMPPIQPRAIQRQAEQAASAVAPTAGTDYGTDNGLPPLPNWARAAMGTDGDHDEPASASSSASVSMPLHAAPAPDAAPVVQREAHEGHDHSPGDGHDHGDDEPIEAAPVQREADDLPGSVDTVDDETPAAAPLLGDRPLGDVPAQRAAADDAGAPTDLDLPLQAPVQREAAPSTASTGVPSSATVDVPAASSPSSRDDDAITVGDDDADDADDAEDVRVAPLLGERPLQLQRVAEAQSIVAPAGPAPANALPLPLVADVANGPALESGPTAQSRGPQAQAAPLAAPVQRVPTGGAAAGPAFSGAVQRSVGGTGVPVPAASAAGLPLRTLAAAPAAPGGSLPSLVAQGTTASPAGAAGFSGDSSVQTMPLAMQAPPAATSLSVQTLHDGGVSGGITSAGNAASGTAPAASMPLQEPASIGDLAVAAGVGHRAPDGSVVFTNPSASGAAANGGTSMSLQRSATGDAGTSGGGFVEGTRSFVVQRELSGDGSGGSSEPTATATGTASDEEKKNDELAEKIYDRIRWKLEADARAEQWRTNGGSWSRKGI